mmetsp:Transcript_49332/g.117371  ORF Transcript_49332/g.117371 Transcript_49332/m.117371 type:complete len:205 (+) Transcript_49332:88-702(+)
MSAQRLIVSDASEVPKGTRVEVDAQGDWWDAEVIKVKQGQAKVHYEGGTEAEQEWIAFDSGRIRLSADSSGTKKKRSVESSGTKQKPEQEKSTVPVGIPTELPFKVKSEAKSKRRQFKPVKKIIEGEGYDKMPLDVPTYTGIEAPPSLLPPKKYCDLTGLEAKFTDPKTRLRYFSASEFAQVRTLGDHSVEEFLKFRNANVNLK